MLHAKVLEYHDQPPRMNWRQILSKVLFQQVKKGICVFFWREPKQEVRWQPAAGSRAGHGGLETLSPTSAAAFLPSFLVSPRFSLASNSPKNKIPQRKLDEKKSLVCWFPFLHGPTPASIFVFSLYSTEN